jgi:hypothetical protein
MLSLSREIAQELATPGGAHGPDELQRPTTRGPPASAPPPGEAAQGVRRPTSSTRLRGGTRLLAPSTASSKFVPLSLSREGTSYATGQMRRQPIFESPAGDPEAWTLALASGRERSSDLAPASASFRRQASVRNRGRAAMKASVRPNRRVLSRAIALARFRRAVWLIRPSLLKQRRVPADSPVRRVVFPACRRGCRANPAAGAKLY